MIVILLPKLSCYCVSVIAAHPAPVTLIHPYVILLIAGSAAIFALYQNIFDSNLINQT